MERKQKEVLGIGLGGGLTDGPVLCVGGGVRAGGYLLYQRQVTRFSIILCYLFCVALFSV